ncbi:MAG: hydrogenase formation protein HypD [Bacteroidota bacterium]
MKYVDEFRDGDLIQKALAEIERLCEPGRAYRLMEVCGGHTHAIYRYGLQDLLPDAITLLHGPGCPVCILPMGRLDDGLELAQRHDLTFTAFGDMMRVPGVNGSPLEHQARGLDVRMVYSPLDALKLAREHPDLDVLFFAIGFETTSPSTALTLMQAKAEGIDNFSVMSNHVVLFPALRALLDGPDCRIDGFIGPGHVSTVVGCAPYAFIPEDYGRPVVVSGFEPLDLLQSITMLLRQMNAGEARVENQYTRAVLWEGNLAAQRAMAETFVLRPHFEWRGMGSIPGSAHGIAPAYAAWDAEVKYEAPAVEVAEPCGACCGQVLTGTLQPDECGLFSVECTPERPVGALMVSSEGACAAHYNYAPRIADLEILA